MDHNYKLKLAMKINALLDKAMHDVQDDGYHAVSILALAARARVGECEFKVIVNGS